MSKSLPVLMLLLCGLSACNHAKEGPYFSATRQAYMSNKMTFAEARISAIQVAERLARDQILLQARNRTFLNGVTLEDAMVVDPFLRAKVFDTIRSAKISDQTIKREEGIVTVTVTLDMGPIDRLLSDPNRQPLVPEGAFRQPRPDAPAEPPSAAPTS